MEQENNGILNLLSKFAGVFNKSEQKSPPPKNTPPSASPKMNNDKAVIDFIRLHDKRRNEILGKNK